MSVSQKFEKVPSILYLNIFVCLIHISCLIFDMVVLAEKVEFVSINI